MISGLAFRSIRPAALKSTRIGSQLAATRSFLSVSLIWNKKSTTVSKVDPFIGGIRGVSTASKKSSTSTRKAKASVKTKTKKAKNAKATKLKAKKKPVKPKTKKLRVSRPKDVPARPLTVWQVYIKENMKDASASGMLKDSIKQLSASFKNLSATEKQRYQHFAEQDKTRYDGELKTYLASKGLKALQEENTRRRKLAKRDSKRLLLLKDPLKPKRPLNSFGLFLKDFPTLYPTENKLPFKERVAAISRLYKQLDSSRKMTYDNRATNLKKQYDEDIASYKAKASL
ncbi:hypothetical protein V1511DRAFT_504244 [Dipodascopsis uninucleata]